MRRFPLGSSGSALARAPVLCLTCAALGALAAAQSQKLNGPLAQPYGGHFWSQQLTLDGTRVVYTADQVRDEVVELYVVPVDGTTAPLALSGVLGPTESVYRGKVELSPDGRGVVYLGKNWAGYPRLFHAPLDGSTDPVQITEPIYVVDLDVFRFQISLDGRWVLYREDIGMHLRAAPTDGSQPPILLASAFSIFRDFGLTPDGTRAVYLRADADTSFDMRLFSRVLDGSAPEVQLSSAVVDNGYVFETSPSGQVVYRADAEVEGRFELFAVPADGSAPPRKLSAPLVTGGDVQRAWISPDSRRVVYLADAEVDERSELYSVPLDGSAVPIRLNGALVPGGGVGTLYYEASPVRITSDSSRVLFLADAAVDGRFELHVVPIDGRQEPERISGRMVTGGNVRNFALAPDDRTVVYQADQRSDEVFELFAVCADVRHAHLALSPHDATPRRLNPTPVVGGDVFSFAISPDGRGVAYWADLELDRRTDLYGVALEGGPSTRLRDSDSLGYPSEWLVIGPPTISTIGSRVVFTHRLSPEDSPGLFSVPIDRGSEPLRLTPPLALGPVEGDVYRFKISPDERWTVYLADQDQDFVDELYSVPTDGSQPPVKLNGPLPPEGDVGGSADHWVHPDDAFRIAPDGTRVVYLADQDVADEVELYLAPIDGHAPATRLGSGPGVQLGFQVGADSARVVYLRRDALGTQRLFSQGLAGGAAPVELSGALVAGGNVEAFALSSDAAWVVFRADAQADERDRLYTVPSDGSLPRTRIELFLDADRDVTDFVLTQDSARVVFLANAREFAQLELYSAPIDGQGPALELDPELVGTGPVKRFEASPDGAWVVFVTNTTPRRLYSVPSDGSAAPRKLNGPLVAGGNVDARAGGFRISPDSRWVAYVADQSTDEVHELFARRIDASRPPVRVNDALPAGADVLDSSREPAHQISADSRRVLFLQNVGGRVDLHAAPIGGAGSPLPLTSVVPGSWVDSFQVDERGLTALYLAYEDYHSQPRPKLYSTPVDGSRRARRIDDTPPEGHVSEARFGPLGRYVLYLADLGDSGIFELFSYRLPRSPRAAPEPLFPPHD